MALSALEFRQNGVAISELRHRIGNDRPTTRIVLTVHGNESFTGLDTFSGQVGTGPSGVVAISPDAAGINDGSEIYVDIDPKPALLGGLCSFDITWAKGIANGIFTVYVHVDPSSGRAGAKHRAG